LIGSANGTIGKGRAGSTDSVDGRRAHCGRHRWPRLPQLDAKVA
jgi:hypothetical protein